MSESQAIRFFSGFCEALRREGLKISANHTSNFLAATSLITLENLGEIYWAGRATLVDHRDNIDTYNATFEIYFRRLGQEAFEFGAPEETEDRNNDSDDDIKIDSVSRTSETDQFELVESSGSSKKSSLGETLVAKNLNVATKNDRFYIRLITALSRKQNAVRKIRRHKVAQKGKLIDLHGSLRQVFKTDGELMKLLCRNPKNRIRPALILVDVSGSMELQIRANLFFAYALTMGLKQCETFSIGTRLTHLSDGFRTSNLEQMRKAMGKKIVDWEGGTRLGDGLAEFLSKWRFRVMVQNTDVFICSDGLERGDSKLLIQSVGRISRNCANLYWLSPLASDPEYRPETRAMAEVSHMCHAIYPAANLSDIYASLKQIWNS